MGPAERIKKMRYYIADPHFFHESMNEQMDRRGVADVEQMNAYMLRRWNEKVRDNDEVVILGDLSWGKPEETNELLARLKGRLYLIQGNHDRFLTDKKYDASRFVWIRPYEELKDNGRKVVLCHYPILFYNGQNRIDGSGEPLAYMLYGHVHDTLDQRLVEQFQEITQNSFRETQDGKRRAIPSNLINCFCMYSDYTPLTLDEWIRCDRSRRQARQQADLAEGI